MRLVNVVSTCKLGCRLDLIHISKHLLNIEYNPKKFSAIILRHKQISGCCLVFNSGSLVISGNTSIKNARISVRRFARLIQKLKYPVQIQNFKIQTMTCVFKVNQKVSLSNLHDVLPFGIYEPEIFNGLLYKVDGITFSVLHSGAIIATGVKSIKSVKRNYRILSNLIEFI